MEHEAANTKAHFGEKLFLEQARAYGTRRCWDLRSVTRFWMFIMRWNISAIAERLHYRERLAEGRSIGSGQVVVPPA